MVVVVMGGGRRRNVRRRGYIVEVRSVVRSAATMPLLGGTAFQLKLLSVY